jgi:hypothetical protein
MKTIGVVGFNQINKILKLDFYLDNAKEDDYRFCFCVDPKIFKYVGVVKGFFTIFTPLYVSEPEKQIHIAFTTKINREYMFEEVQKLKKSVYTWLLCWKHMKIHHLINKDVSILIAKFILFRTRLGINIFLEK